MRAAFIRNFGGPEAVQIGQLDKPVPKHGEVLVRIKASALNHLDVWVRKGRPGAEIKQAHVLGSDAAGLVEQLGEGVEGLAPGDEVVINAGVSCMQCGWCKRGDHSECPKFRLLGFQLPGTHAEYIVVPAVNVAHKPLHLSWPEAAALPLAHLTAWHMLFPRARFRVGETVLIHGIGGGVALAALQIVKMTGGKAIVTSGSDEKLARAKELGAAHGINYKTEPKVAEKVRELTGGRGADIAFDTVGAPTFPISFEAVRRGGRIVTCGVTGGRVATVNLQLLYWNHISLIGSTMGSLEDFQCLLSAVGMAHLRPVVDRVYKLEQYAEAVQRMEAGAQFGKIVLDVDA